MGYSLSWAALKGGSLETICSVFGLRRTDQKEEIAESEIDAAQIPTGWCLVLFNRKEIEERLLRELSQFGEVVYCFVEDHVMFSTASGWRSGTSIWSVTHDCNKGRFHLEVTGTAPPAIEEIRKKLFAEQHADGGEKSDTDFVYDAPAELAKSLTGFRHDQDMPGMSGDVFQVLEPAAAKSRGIFSRLFRGRERSQ
jgi:hypothetical protein